MSDPPETSESFEADDVAFKRAFAVVNKMLVKRGYLPLPTSSEGTVRKKYSDYDAFTCREDDEDDSIWVFFVDKLKSVEKYDEIRNTSGVHRAIIVSKVAPSKRKGPDAYETFTFAELAFDVTEHSLQPRFEVLTSERRKEILSRFGSASTEAEALAIALTFPKMLTDDPVARYFGLKPGAVVKVTRNSDTSGTSESYSVVVSP